MSRVEHLLVSPAGQGLALLIAVAVGIVVVVAWIMALLAWWDTLR